MEIFKKLALIVLPILVAAFFASIIPRKREERKQFNKAAALFRDAFLPEITFLKHNAIVAETGSSNDLCGFLQYGYVHRHLKAYETFRPYLSPVKRVCIDKAWKEYCYNKDDPKILFFEQYFTGGVSKGEKETKQALALERIERILEFAKHK